MTLHGLVSRFHMFFDVLDIAFRSLAIGKFVKQKKYRKYGNDFSKLLQERNPSKGFSVTEDEAYTIYASIKSVEKVEGDLAEFGVYKGATAKLICQVKGSKKLYLFDTFEGMPNRKISNLDRWRPNTHKDTDFASVRKYLSMYDRVVFVPGEFPESIKNNSDLKDVRYSFVNLDVDLYESTLSGLKYFFPKLNKGGRLVSHNYNLKYSDGGDTPGVKQAFDDYFLDRKHLVIEIAETQCLVIKD